MAFFCKELVDTVSMTARGILFCRINVLFNIQFRVGKDSFSFWTQPVCVCVTARVCARVCVCKRIRGVIRSDPLKLMDKFTYLSSSVSSTESDINIRLAKTWTTIDRLSI